MQIKHTDFEDLKKLQARNKNRYKSFIFASTLPLLEK